MEKIQEFCKNHIVNVFVCVAVLFFVVGCWCLYTTNRTVNEYSDVHESVERTEAGIDRAEYGARTAQTEIKNAQEHIQRADETAGKLTERTQRNTEELNDCQHLVDRMSERSERIQRIIADIEERNKNTGAQADSNP